MVAKINFSDLVIGAADGTLSQDQLRSYFKLDEAKTQPFDPHFRIDYANVDVTGLEQTAASAGDALALEAGQNAFQPEADAIPQDGTYVAEGDSWFKLPPIIYPRTMADILAMTYPVTNLAHWGDTLASMIAAGQYVPFLRTGKVKFLLFSGGGDDILGDTLERSLKIYDTEHNKPSDAHWYLTDLFYNQLNTVIADYTRLIAQVRTLSPSTRIVVHGYDYARPVENGIFLGIHLMRQGLHPADHPALCQNIIKVMVDLFNRRLSALAHDPSFLYVDLRGTVGANEWYDQELHPSEAAAGRMAAKLAVALGAAPVPVASVRGTAAKGQAATTAGV